MSNTIKILTAVSKEFNRRFRKAVPLLEVMNRQYDKRYEAFGAAAGESIQITKPIRLTAHTTQAAVAQNFEEQTATLTNTYWSGSFLAFSASELTDDLMNPNNMKLFGDDKLQAAVDTVAADVHYRVSGFLYQNTYNAVGTPGSDPANHQVITQARAKITSYGAPLENRAVILNPDAMASLNYGMAGLFNGQDQLKKQLVSGYVNDVSGFTFYETPILANHTRGTAVASASYTVTGAGQTGATLNVTGGAGTTWKKGDVFTLAGVKAVHPLSKRSLPFLQKFVVTADATADGGGAVALSISPSITTSGAYQTVSGSPANGAAVVIDGTASIEYTQGFALQKDSFVFATQRIRDIGAPLEGSYAEDGINFKLTCGGDVNNMVSQARIDMKFGLAALLPEWATRIWCNDVA